MNAPLEEKNDFDKEANVGFQHFMNAFRFSMQGLKAAYKYEAAFRQELALCLFLFPLAFWIGDNQVEVAILIFVSLVVIVVELLNSGIEAVVDRFGGKHHELSGRAKDLGSAAVMVALVAGGVVWLLILHKNWTTLIDSLVNPGIFKG